MANYTQNVEFTSLVNGVRNIETFLKSREGALLPDHVRLRLQQQADRKVAEALEQIDADPTLIAFIPC